MLKSLYSKVFGISMLIISIVATTSEGQTYWNRSYEAIPYDKIGKVIPTRDCNFIAIGSFDDKACIIKMSPYGDSLWTRLSAGEMGTTGFSSITPAHDGDFIAVGCNQKKVTIMKIKSTGELVWTKVYTEGGQYSYADVGITPLADGNFVAMGCNISYESAWFLKFDSEGKVIQNKILPINFKYGCLVAKSDGSFLVAGNPVYRISCTGEILNSYYIPDIGGVSATLKCCRMKVALFWEQIHPRQLLRNLTNQER